MSQSTVSANTADGEGGGIFAYSAPDEQPGQLSNRTLQTLGDSITYGYAATGCPAPYSPAATLANSTCWAALVANSLGYNLSDLGVGGAGVIDVSSIEIYDSPLQGGYNFGQFVPGNSATSTILIGQNDGGAVPNETAPYFNGTREVNEWQMIHEDLVGFMLTPHKLPANSSLCTASAGWTASTLWASGGLQTEVKGATITCPILGSTAYVSVMAQVGNTSSISVAIDGGTPINYTYALSGVSNVLSNTTAGMLLRIPNLASNGEAPLATPHTVAITANVSGSSPVFLNWIDGNGSEQTGGTGPIVFALAPYPTATRNNADGILPTIRGFLSAEEADLRSDGLNEVVGDLSIPCTGIPLANPTAFLCDTFDGTHPTNAGHALIAGYVEQLIQNYVGISNTIVAGNTASIAADTNYIFTDNGGNQVGSTVNLSALGSYGGPTQTMLPQAGSSAICTGILANATAAGITADQRGYTFDPTCPNGFVDAGSTQTAWPFTLSATSLAFGSVSVSATSASQSVTMTNTGTAALSITSIAVTGANTSSFVFANTCGTNLAVGATCTVQGNFAPIATGALTATILITDSEVGSPPQSISLTGTGLPQVTLSATSLAAGSVSVGATGVSQSVTMTNIGTSAVSISSIAVTGANASQFMFANNCGTSLAPGASCLIHGHLAPTSVGTFTAAITIMDSAVGSQQSVALSGNGLAAPVTLSATSLAFGTVSVSAKSASQSVTMTNTGTAALSITSIAVTGANASSFVFANTCGTNLAVGATCTIQGNFAPTATGSLTAAITITDSAVGSPQSIALTGTGSPQVTLSATSLAFGSVNVNATSASQSVTMTNTGAASLSITSIALTGVGATSFVFANGCGTSLAAGANCSIHGHFGPTAVGAVTAAITITDSAVGSPQSIALTGTGSPPVTLSATSLAFGSVSVGATSASQFATVTNTGTASLSITSIAVTGANASSFVLAKTCGTNLAVGASCTIQGNFAPTATGSLTAAIIITDNAVGSPQSITLSGTGLTPATALLSATSLAFASQVIATTGAPQQATLTNTGGAALSISSVSVTGSGASAFALTNGCGTTLAGGATCTLTVQFNPTITGPQTAAVLISDGANNSPQSIALSGICLDLATQLGVGANGPINAGTPFTVTVGALDAVGIPVTTYSGTVTLTSSDPLFVNPGILTLTNGMAQATVMLETAGSQTITATGSGLTGSGIFAVAPGRATSLRIAAPSSAISNTPFSFTVTAYDAYGNQAAGYGGTLAFSSTDANAVLPAPTALAAGTSTFGATLVAPGLQTITATDSANSLSVTSNVIAVPNLVVPSVSSINFGQQPVGVPSAVQTVGFSISPGTTVGSIRILTQGAASLDFADGGSSTCTPTVYPSLTSCTVSVTFTPLAPGTRSGAVLVLDGTGNQLASVPVFGVGTGAQPSFSPAATISITPVVNNLQLAQPCGVAVDSTVNQFIADAGNNRVIKIASGGATTTSIAPSVNGQSLAQPCGLAVDGAGNLYISDTTNNRVVEVPTGGGAPVAISPTVNGLALAQPSALAIDGAGDLFIADAGNNRVVELASGTGTTSAIAPAVSGLALTQPTGLAVDASGDLFISDAANNRIVEMPSGGSATAIAPMVNGEALAQPGALAIDAAGDLFLSDTGNGRIVEVPAGGGTPAAIVPIVNGLPVVQPGGLALDGAGNLFITDAANNRVVKMLVSQPPALSFTTATTVGAIDSTDGTQTVQVHNIGNLPLTLTTVGFPADFSAASDRIPCLNGIALNPGQQCDVAVEFAPQTAGTLGEQVTLTDNAVGSPQSIALSGTGLTPATASLSTTSLGFTSQVIATTSAPQQVTLTNTGAAALSISSVSVIGSGASSFALTNGCGTTLAGGASCTFTVQFNPTIPGAQTASVLISDSANNSPQSIALNGTGLTPATASLSATSLSFGSVLVGSMAAPQQVSLTNTGGNPLGITAIAVSGANPASFAFTNNCGSSLAAGATCIIQVTFQPSAFGPFDEAITLADNASGSPQSIALSGTGVQPQVSLSVTNVPFGSVNVGTSSASQSVTMTNTGSAALSIASIGVIGANASQFVFANNCGTSLAVGASCSIHGHFAPTAAGTFTAAITITDNTVGSPQSIALSGTGLAAPLTLSPTSLAFGSVSVGTSSASQSVTLINSGTAALSITSIVVSGANASQFVFVNTCGTSLGVGASCSIHGHFAPTAAGTFTAAITITDNAVGSPQSIALSGTGLAAPLTLSPTSLAFGSVSVGTSSASQSVTLINSGTAALSITSIVVSGANASSFVFANNCAASLAAGATCNIHGHFAPATTGPLTAVVTITSSAPGSPESFALSGTGQ